MEKYVLALDQGTTSSRAIFFDRSGGIHGTAQLEFKQYYPKDGWVEHDPVEILRSQKLAITAAMEAGEITADRIAAIGITNQRETTVVWDRNTGKPVYNAIVWQCRRTADICEKLIASGLSDYVTEHTGLLIDAYFSATKIKWILDNVEGAREKAERGDLLFGTIDTWLIWWLTGGRVHATDYSNASRTMLFDIDRLEWDDKILNTLGIPKCMMPEARPSSGDFGTVAPGITGLESLVGIPISGVAGDQQAALFGQACFSKGQAKNTYGTGCFLMMNTGETSMRSRNGLVSTVAWGLGGKVEYALEGSVFNAGSVIKWLRDGLGLIKSAPEVNILAESVENAGGVILVPAFTGLGAPYWDMYARGTMVGITRATTAAHIARAVLDSIAYQVKDLITAMEDDVGFKLSELRVDGGASVSNILMQIQSDMLGVAINRPAVVETTALGAAYLAGLHTGFWKDLDDIEKNRKVERIFTPQINEDQRGRRYAEWQRAVGRSRNWSN
ncbi:MAG: glycerol kinase GlpK [Clostridiales bacterium]|nr:glycerol kinase GlpK [Clostridiales bacterium]